MLEEKYIKAEFYMRKYSIIIKAFLELYNKGILCGLP